MAGYDLVGLIFAREISDPLIGLVKAVDKQIDASLVRRRPGAGTPGFHVVFLSDDAGLKERLDRVLAREGIKHVVFSVARQKAAGPPRYKVAADAELTVMIFNNDELVVANHVLDSLDLTVERHDTILKQVRPFLP